MDLERLTPEQLTAKLLKINNSLSVVSTAREIVGYPQFRETFPRVKSGANIDLSSLEGDDFQQSLIRVASYRRKMNNTLGYLESLRQHISARLGTINKLNAVEKRHVQILDLMGEGYVTEEEFQKECGYLEKIQKGAGLSKGTEVVKDSPEVAQPEQQDSTKETVVELDEDQKEVVRILEESKNPKGVYEIVLPDDQKFLSRGEVTGRALIALVMAYPLGERIGRRRLHEYMYLKPMERYTNTITSNVGKLREGLLDTGWWIEQPVSQQDLMRGVEALYFLEKIDTDNSSQPPLSPKEEYSHLTEDESAVEAVPSEEGVQTDIRDLDEDEESSQQGAERDSEEVEDKPEAKFTNELKMIVFEKDPKHIMLNGQVIKLTESQIRVLNYLINCKGGRVSTHDLCTAAFQTEPQKCNISQVVNQLKDKINSPGEIPLLISSPEGSESWYSLRGIEVEFDHERKIAQKSSNGKKGENPEDLDRQQQWESVEQNRINTIIDQMNGNGLTDLTVEINAHDIAIRFFPTNDTGRVISDLKNIYRRCIKPTRTEGHHVFYRADAIGAYMYIREASAGNGHANLTPRLIKQIKAKIRERYEEMRLEVKQKSQECNKLDLVRV